MYKRKTNNRSETLDGFSHKKTGLLPCLPGAPDQPVAAAINDQIKSAGVQRKHKRLLEDLIDNFVNQMHHPESGVTHKLSVYIIPHSFCINYTKKKLF